MSVRCPYDPAHIMPRQSLTNHIRKCKAPNKHLFVQCKYNLQHVIRKENISKHYQTAHGKEQTKGKEEEADWLSEDEKKPSPKKQKPYEKPWLKEVEKKKPQQDWDVSRIQHVQEQKPKKKKKNHKKVEDY